MAGKAPQGQTTRQRLLTAAAELLSEGGYSAASVGAIAQRVGLSAGALYRHFPSKAELFVEVFQDAARRDLEVLDLIEPSGPTEMLMTGIETYARRMLADRRLAWALVHEPVDPAVDAERLLYRREYTRRVVRLIRRAIDDREIPYQDAAISAAAITGALSEALVGPLSPIAADGEPDDVVVDHILRFCRQALGAATSPTVARGERDHADDQPNSAL